MDTATSLNNLAGLLRTQQEYRAARLLYEQALQVTKQVLGPDHPHTQIVRDDFAALDAA